MHHSALPSTSAPSNAAHRPPTHHRTARQLTGANEAAHNAATRVFGSYVMLRLIPDGDRSSAYPLKGIKSSTAYRFATERSDSAPASPRRCNAHVPCAPLRVPPST
jgi:hypothetical protein